MFLSTKSSKLITCRFHHKGHEDIVITVIDLEAAGLASNEKLPRVDQHIIRTSTS
jgi:hypothetical protein